MAKSIKTNSIQELMRSKGISTKAVDNRSEVVPRETSRRRLYDLVETEHKLDTNRTQTEHTTGHNQNRSQTQTEHKPDTNRTQIVHKLNTKPDTNRTQTEHKKHKSDTNRTQTEHTTGHNQNTNRTQTGHKLDTNLSIPTLVGLQKKLLVFFYDDCKHRRSNTTQEMTVQFIADQLKIAPGSVKTTIMRLVEKGFVRRNYFKAGRGGWSSFEIPDAVYNEIALLENLGKLNTNWTQTGHKLNTQPDTQPDTNPPCSSSINKTTTTEKEEILIPHALQKMSVKAKSLEPALAAGLSVFEIQESLEAFAHDLANGLVRSETPLAMLYGILRNGRLYLSATYTEKLNREIDEELKRIDEADKKKQTLEEVKFKTAFATWVAENPELVEQLTFSADYSIQNKPKLIEAYLMQEYRKLTAEGSEISKK